VPEATPIWRNLVGLKEKLSAKTRVLYDLAIKCLLLSIYLQKVEILLDEGGMEGFHRILANDPVVRTGSFVPSKLGLFFSRFFGRGFLFGDGTVFFS